MKLLLSAYACNPEIGTEARNGWNLAVSLAERGHQVWVLTHPSGNQPIERATAIGLPTGLTLQVVHSPRWIKPWSATSYGWRFDYPAWQHAAYRVASDLDRRIDFNIVHHVTWGSLKGGSPLWRLGKPFLLGPVGGAQMAPTAFKRYFMEYWREEAWRSFVTAHLRYLPSAYNAVRHAHLVLATNQDTLNMARQLGARRLEYCLDCALPSDFAPNRYPQRPERREMTLIWVGHLMPNKALLLALEALAQVDARLPVRLQILGSGLLRAHLDRWLQELNLQERVAYLGQVEWTEVKGILLASDALLFTSLRDSSGVQVLEAMALGLPVITLDHQGAGDMVSSETGMKVPVTTPEETAAGLAAAIEHLYHNPEARHEFGRRGWEVARQHTWPERAAQMERYYLELIGRPDAVSDL